MNVDECKIIFLELDNSESLNILKVSSFLEAAITENSKEIKHISRKKATQNLKNKKQKRI